MVAPPLWLSNIMMSRAANEQFYFQNFFHGSPAPLVVKHNDVTCSQ